MRIDFLFHCRNQETKVCAINKTGVEGTHKHKSRSTGSVHRVAHFGPIWRQASRGRVLGRRSLARSLQTMSGAEKTSGVVKRCESKWQIASGSNYFCVRGANEWNRAVCVPRQRDAPWAVPGVTAEGKSRSAGKRQRSVSPPVRVQRVASRLDRRQPPTSEFEQQHARPSTGLVVRPLRLSGLRQILPQPWVSLIWCLIFRGACGRLCNSRARLASRSDALPLLVFSSSHNCFSNSSRFRKTVNSLLICARRVIFLSLPESGGRALFGAIFQV